MPLLNWYVVQHSPQYLVATLSAQLYAYTGPPKVAYQRGQVKIMQLKTNIANTYWHLFERLLSYFLS
jgi:hypothetical protein